MKMTKLWEEFLKTYESQGAHFHGEGDPPDLILEVRPTAESQDWLWVYRPEGTEPTDEVKNEMCKEMMEQLQKKG